MGDLAALTLAIDSTPVISGEESLKRLAVAATEAELQAVRMGTNMDSAFKKMSASAIASSNASANAYMGLSTSVKEVEKSTSSATSMMDRMGNRVENMALRSAVHFALITVAIMGTMKALETLIGLGEKWDKFNASMETKSAAGALSGANIWDQMRQESDGTSSKNYLKNDAASEAERMAVLRTEFIATSPEMANAIDMETMSYSRQLEVMKELNQYKIMEDYSTIQRLQNQGPRPGLLNGALAALGNQAGLGIIGDYGTEGMQENTGAWRDQIQGYRKDVAARTRANATLDGVFQTDKTGAGTTDTTTQYGREIQRLQEQLAGFTQGEEAAYAMKLRLMDNGAGGSVNKALDLRGQVLSAQDDRASADFAHSLSMKQSDDYRTLKESLDPLYKQSLDYANAVYLITQNTEDAEQRTRLLGSAYRTLSQDGMLESSSAAFAKNLDMKDSDDYRSLKYSLDPAYKAALDYANAVRLINANTEDAGERTKLLAAALATLTPDGVAAAEALNKLNAEAARLNQKDDFTTRVNHLNEVNGTGNLKTDAYADALQKIMKSNDSPLGPMIQAMDQFGDSAANAMGRWATGMDGAAIHWSSMIRSMMADWASAEAKKGMSSLFGYLEGGMSGLLGIGASGSSDYSSGNGAEFGNMGGSTYTPYPTNAGATIAPNVAVTVNNTGAGVTGSVMSGPGGAQLGQAIHAAVLKVVQTELRPGGSLNGVN